MITRQEHLEGKELPALSICDFNRAVYWQIQESMWWKIVSWRFILGPFFRLLMRLNLWKLDEGAYYIDGRFNLPWSRR